MRLPYWSRGLGLVVWWVVLWPLALSHVALSALGGDAEARARLDKVLDSMWLGGLVLTAMWAAAAAKIAGLT